MTAAEIYFEHDSASFGNKMMWLPVALGPVGAAAGVSGFLSKRMAKTALPLASAAIVANGAARHLPARPRHRPEAGRLVELPATTWRWGRRCWRRCWSPWSAAWACSPRSCGGRSDPQPPELRHTAPTGSPASTSSAQADHWDPVTAGVVLARIGPPRRHPLLHPRRGGHRHRPRRPAARPAGRADESRSSPLIDARLAEQQTDGWHYDDMPADGEAWRDTLADLDADAQALHGDGFASCARGPADAI